MGPKLVVIAGAPGSGKSRAFPVSGYGVDFFNADDRAAQISGGYHNISLEVREVVNREFELFIEDHLQSKTSFAFETTLRSSITFDQIETGRRNGFEITMVYLGLSDLQINLSRIALRYELGYHAAPADVLTAIHAKSLQNLRTACCLAFGGTLRLLIYDNTAIDEVPALACEITQGVVQLRVDHLPQWIGDAVAQALPGISPQQA